MTTRHNECGSFSCAAGPLHFILREGSVVNVGPVSARTSLCGHQQKKFAPFLYRIQAVPASWTILPLQFLDAFCSFLQRNGIDNPSVRFGLEGSSLLNMRAFALFSIWRNLSSSASWRRADKPLSPYHMGLLLVCDSHLTLVLKRGMLPHDIRSISK